MLKSIFLLLTLCMASSLSGMPSQIIIIRHAEKAAQGDGLSTKGRERAAALAPYFMERKEVLTFGAPAAIYAMGTSKEDTSKRPIETVTPLAEQLRLTINTSYTNETVKKMVDEIKNSPGYSGKMVLICWEHVNIPQIARAFSALQTPARWPDEVFDRNWVITYSLTGKANFQNMPQRLLFGDSAK